MKSIYSDEAFFSKIDVNAENLVALLAENYKKILNVGKKGNMEYERGNYEWLCGSSLPFLYIDSKCFSCYKIR